MTNNIITQDILKARLHYNPESGVFTWLDNRSGRVNIGDICGWDVLLQNKEYRSIQVLNKTYLAHRLAWLYVHGEFPPNDIDHINGNGRDNSINNIRVVTHQENMLNKKRYKSNKSGCSGVLYIKSRDKFAVQISIDKKQRFLGYFANIWDAICCRKSAEFSHGFHINHGK